MTEELKNILLKIINNGYEAYIVGGYVRDHLLGKESFDIDIATNALPKDLTLIFDDKNVKISKYGSIKMLTNKYDCDITTFRKELKYKDGKPDEIEYVNSIDEDINRRDFTINALYMDIDGNIIDKINGLNDIKNKSINVIGNIDIKLKEDPLRMLRALRFKITLGFKLDERLLDYIIKHKKELATIPKSLVKNELNKILVSKNVISGLDYLKKMGVLDILGIKYDSIKYTEDITSLYAQLSLSDDYPFTKEEKSTIEDIKKIVDYGIIDYGILFEYGLYLCLFAGEILGYNKKDINELYQSMPIKSSKELMIDGNEIQDLLQIEPSKVIKDITDSLIVLVLNNVIKNDKDILKKYIINNKGMWLK